jgi:putative membrane protein
MSTKNYLVCARSLAVLSLVLGSTIAHAQTGSGTAPADSQIRKDAPSMQKDGKGASSAAGTISKGDLNMMRDMAHSNIAEIETGKLAQSKSQNAEVKKFAQQMIDDHTKAQAELQKVAESKGAQLPSDPDKKHQAMVKKMQGMSGEEFDRMYMKQGGVNDHQKTLKLLQKAQKDAKDPDLKALAAKMTPTVEQHLQMAKQHVDGGKGGAASK